MAKAEKLFRFPSSDALRNAIVVPAFSDRISERAYESLERLADSEVTAIGLRNAFGMASPRLNESLSDWLEYQQRVPVWIGSLVDDTTFATQVHQSYKEVLEKAVKNNEALRHWLHYPNLPKP